jgi:hypothetical protein
LILTCTAALVSPLDGFAVTQGTLLLTLKGSSPPLSQSDQSARREAQDEQL